MNLNLYIRRCSIGIIKNREINESKDDGVDKYKNYLNGWTILTAIEE